MEKTGERLVHVEDWKTLEDYLMFSRELFAYDFSKNNVDFGATVLEVGFGEGFGAKLLGEKAGEVVALEVDKKAVSHAKKKYSSEKLSFQLYDGKKIPFKENSFDLIVSLQVIEHIQDDLNFVNEINRVAKKGAKIIIATPNAKTRMIKNGKSWNEFHVREYTEESLRKLFDKKVSSVEILGITAKEEVLEIERERVKKAFFLASLDPLKLRRFLPDSLKSRARKTVKKISGYEKTVFDTEKFSYKDFFISKNNIDECIDLLAICKK